MDITTLVIICGSNGLELPNTTLSTITAFAHWYRAAQGNCYPWKRQAERVTGKKGWSSLYTEHDDIHSRGLVAVVVPDLLVPNLLLPPYALEDEGGSLQ